MEQSNSVEPTLPALCAAHAALQAEAGTAAGEDDSPEAAAAAKEKANAARQAARQAHSQFRVGDSDALSALRALCAFEAAGEDQGFCK